MQLKHQLLLIYVLMGALIMAFIFLMLRTFSINHSRAQQHTEYTMTIKEFDQHLRYAMEKTTTTDFIRDRLTRVPPLDEVFKNQPLSTSDVVAPLSELLMF